MAKKKRKFDKSDIIKLCVLGVFFCVFCVSAYMVISQLVTEQHEAEAFDVLLRQVQGTNEPDGIVDVMPGNMLEGEDFATLELLARYAALHEQNSDLFGWISIPNTTVNYPVMHTPNDPEYYLHRAFDRTTAKSGVPFMDGKSYTDCGNYLVYGHKMKNGTMFAPILDYENREFWEQHPIIRFDTLDEVAEYEVFAACYTQVYTSADPNAFRYYRYPVLTDPVTYAEYVDGVKAMASYDTGITPQFGEQLLTLSTCSYHVDEGRFIVVARKIG